MFKFILKNGVVVLALLPVFCNCQNTNYVYPETKKVNQSDVYFGTKIDDPYRWLEEQESVETKAWVEQQTAFTKKYLDKIPNNFTLREQIKRNTQIEYLNPRKKGDYYFVLHRPFGFRELTIYYKKNYHDDWEELFVTKDLKLKKEENISIEEFEVSANSKYIAYLFDKNGSDWKEIKIADLETQKSLPDHLYDIKFSSIVWRGNGFYYTKYDREKTDNQYKQLAVNGKLYYHTLGTLQEKDSVIFKKNSSTNNRFIPIVSENGRYLIINDHDPVNNTNAYYYYDFENTSQTTLLPLFKKSTTLFTLLGSEQDNLIFKTKINNKYKLISVNPKTPTKWLEKGHELENLIVDDIIYYNGQMIQLTYYNQQDVIVVFDTKGSIIKKVELPLGASCEFSGIDKKSNQLLLSYESYLHPPLFASMDLITYKFELLEKPRVSYDFNDFEISKIQFKSDTAMVPMILIHKKGIKLNGNNPVLIGFYGGFGITVKGSYDPGKITFIENGGIYAFAMIRGGGDKGSYWHEDGALFNRQKSINDIINAAQYLIDKKYTNSTKIAITGGSHGGLMTGAVAIQRPDLFAAAIPVVGVFDMLRFDKFTVGTFHTDEFGTVKDSLQFLNIKSFSPLHNIKAGTKYPKMLIMTSAYDDRVPPLHSYKFTATLQELSNKENPILLRVEKNAGHDGARNYDSYVDKTVDFYSFILNALGESKYK